MRTRKESFFLGRWLLVFLCLALLLGGGKAFADTDTIESGETPQPGSTSGGEMDMWTFTCTAGDRVFINVEKTGGDSGYSPMMQLIDPYSNTEIPFTTDDFTDHVCVQTGEYMIIITDEHMYYSGTYALSLLNVTAGPYTSPEDPDGGPIYSGDETTTGLTSSYGDMDVFTFYGEAGDRVFINLEYTGGSSYYDPHMLIFAPDGSTELGWTLTDFHDLVLSQTGEYMVIVKADTMHYSGTYALTLLNVTAGPYDCPEDPDGGPIYSGDETTTGLTSSYGDMDVFTFYGEAGDRVFINLEYTGGSSYYDPHMLIFAPDGSTELGWTLTDFHDLVLSQTGEYMVIVKADTMHYSGTYAFTLLNLNGATSSPSDCDGGIINPGGQKSGSTTAYGDMDVFFFYGDAGDRVFINLEYTGGSSYYDPYMLIFAPDGSTELDWTLVDFHDITLGQTGEYMVIIRANSMYYSGTYVLTLNKLPPTVNPYNQQPVSACDQQTVTNLCWDSVAGATGYDVFFMAQGLAPFEQVGANVSETCFEVSGLEKNTVYYWYRIAHTATGDIRGTVNWFFTEISCDIDHDCDCDGTDWFLFSSDWSNDCSDPEISCVCDLDNDYDCDGTDWFLFSQNWDVSVCTP